MSIDILGLELQLEENNNSGVKTYVFWVNDSNGKKQYWNIIMADLNKIQDGHRRNALWYCIEDIHMVRKHSFVYLNMYMLLPYQPVIKFES